MPAKAKGTRLYLRHRKGREPQWVIRDRKKQISTGCSEECLGAAEESLAAYLQFRFRPNTSERDLDKIKIAEVLAMYGMDLPQNSPSRELVGYHMKALLPFWGERTLADVKGSTCRSYLAIRCERSGLRSVKPSTVRRELKTFQAAINHWHKESPLSAVPKVTLPEEGSRRERFLERSEAAALLRAAHRLGAKHVARFIIIGLYTGTRHNAILRLRWDAALHGGHPDLERGILYRRGSAEKETSKRRPPVRLEARLCARMRRWKAADESCIYVIHYHGSPILKMKRAWARVVKEAGLGKDVTPHVLRHTAACWLLWEGKTIWEVAGILGADASTIERTYGHHQIEREAKQRA